MAERLRSYYDGIEDLCVRLRAVGEDRWANSLTNAMSGSTSGEILSRTANVLQRFLMFDEAEELGLGDAVADVFAEAEALMNGEV